MRFRLLPCAFQRDLPHSPDPPPQPLTSFLVHGEGGAGPLAIDAGSLGLVGEAPDMARVRDVLLTHPHMDHVATLPMWIEACLAEDRAPVRVHGSASTVEALRTHLFNDVLYPDFEALTQEDGRQLLEYGLVPVDQPFSLSGFTIQAVPARHPVPTHGYLVDDGKDAVLFAADSGPNPELWSFAAGAERLRAVVLETSFPDFMEPIALGAGHLTPALLAEEVRLAPEGVAIHVCHLKPAHRDGIARAIAKINDPRVKLLRPGVEIEV